MIEKSKIIAILKSEGYPEFMHETTYQKISRFNEMIASPFISWVENEEIPIITVEGYSFEFLVSKMNMQPIGAFITLDWLLRDPQKAKNALARGIK